MSEWERALYTVRYNGFICWVTKFDGWYNPLGYYVVTKLPKGEAGCQCPQRNRSDCRHRIMLRLFERERKINSGWFYDYDNQVWERPLNDAVRLMQQRKARATG